MKIEPNVQSSNGRDPTAAIAAVARSHFQRFGYAKTSMQEIAADCDMSVANLYRYYDGKLAIGAAVAVAGQAALFADCDAAVAAAPADLAAKLTALFQALVDGTLRQIKTTPLLFELGMTVAREQPQHRQRFLQETEARLTAILAAQGRTGAQTTIDPKAASRLILLACAPFVLPWLLRTQPFGNPRAQVEPLLHCLVAGLMKTDSMGAATAPNHRRLS
ncbi:MAG: TetR/AcrR family transcriptional regulator [Opitutales bacterium]